MKKIFVFVSFILISFSTQAQTNKIPDGFCELYGDTITETIQLHAKDKSLEEIYQLLLPSQDEPKFSIFYMMLPMAIFHKLELMKQAGENQPHQHLQEQLAHIRTNCNSLYEIDVETINSICTSMSELINLAISSSRQEKSKEALDLLLIVSALKAEEIRSFHMPNPDFAVHAFNNIYQKEIRLIFNQPNKTEDELKQNFSQRCSWP